jgi:PAS domain S-box-containing protein
MDGRYAARSCLRKVPKMKKEAFNRVVADNAPVLLWVSDPEQQRTYVNKRWLDFTGRPLESELGCGWMEDIHPDDLPRCREIYLESFAGRREFKVEYRLRRHDGEFCWVSDTGVPFCESDNAFSGYIGICIDITDRTLAVKELLQNNARLIEGQEKERTRIARELHDDIGSSLAILGIDILGAGQCISDAPGQKHPGIQEIYQKLQEIASRVSRISHQLHPSTLEYFGLAKAIGTECRTFSETCQMPVVCSCKDIPADLDPFVALSFLRIVQEALHNAAKHSRADQVSVETTADSSNLTLQILDNGIGFNVEQSRLAAGLGLISMRERMRLVGGVFEIWSEPGRGTKITCRAPVCRS